VGRREEKAAKEQAWQRTQSPSLGGGGETKKNVSKLNERTGNLCENKGALWKTWVEPDISLKKQVLTKTIRQCY
jgi:hypothetical protein